MENPIEEIMVGEIRLHGKAFRKDWVTMQVMEMVTEINVLSNWGEKHEQ